jgi:membrane protease YdiL (CAAX protease family)
VWTPPVEEGESGIGVGEALLVTGCALAASLVLTLGMRGQHVDQYDVALRKGLVYTLFFYLVVGSALGCYVVARRVCLVWHRGSALAAVAMGIPFGVGGGTLAVALNSALRGHLSGDPNVELLVGGGGALRISLTLVVTTVLAPLVEETVFRGVCAGSLLAKGSAAALWLSALAFAIWHMHPASLRYYALMGLLLGRLWQKRGLLGSMSAHACFNGVLTLAAIAATTGVEADVTVASQPGHMLVVPSDGVLYTIVIITGGSPNGEADWHHLEQTLHLSPQG